MTYTHLWKAYTFPFQNFLTNSLSLSHTHTHTHIFHTSKKMTPRHSNEQALISLSTPPVFIPYATTYIMRLIILVENGKMCPNVAFFNSP